MKISVCRVLINDKKKSLRSLRSLRLKKTLAPLSELTRSCGDAEDQRVRMRELSTAKRTPNLPNHKNSAAPHLTRVIKTTAHEPGRVLIIFPVRCCRMNRFFSFFLSHSRFFDGRGVEISPIVC